MKLYAVEICMKGMPRDRSVMQFKAAFYPKLERKTVFKLDGKRVIKEEDVPFVESELAKLCRRYRLKGVSYEITDLQELQRNYEGLAKQFGDSCPILSSGINAKMAMIKDGLNLANLDGKS